ncbi:MAG TPA: hypothetical protein VG106_02415 [Vicinamibacterales bacterium]|nr:hypothetical protein [Vicinamibacterales bacterium]
MTEPRKLLGRSATAATRESIYETPHALEIEATEMWDIVRRRVYFDDVLMVTYHREYGIAYLLITAFVALVMLTPAALILIFDRAAWPVTIFFFLIGFPALIGFILRVALGLDVITVFGRRTKASLKFGVRKERARQLYGQICATVRAAQRRIEEENAATEPPAVTPPLPPSS